MSKSYLSRFCINCAGVLHDGHCSRCAKPQDLPNLPKGVCDKCEGLTRYAEGLKKLLDEREKQYQEAVKQFEKRATEIVSLNQQLRRNIRNLEEDLRVAQGTDYEYEVEQMRVAHERDVAQLDVQHRQEINKITEELDRYRGKLAPQEKITDRRFELLEVDVDKNE